MKEKIYTIPLTEAFDKDCECAFCEIERKLDTEILDYILGPSYMEEDIRTETNKHGFCKYHYDKMFHAQNRLGVALMVSTHLKKIRTDIESVMAEEQNGGKRGIFQKLSADSPVFDYTNALTHDCYACSRAEARMDEYVDTFFYLWKREPDFREKVKSCKGFCLNHFSRLLAEGRQKLNNDAFKGLLAVLVPQERENLSRISDELDWFIQKFDYRFQNEPWKNSKDSLERAILKISSARLD